MSAPLKMNTLEHNKTVGILNLIYGGLNSLGLLAGIVFILLGGFAGAFDVTAGEVVLAVTWLYVALFIVLLLLFGVPPLLAGYGLLTMKRWARTAGIASSVVSAINFPFGTGLAVYTFWFLFNDGKELYEGRDATIAGRNRTALGGARGPMEYIPPAQPPNWHD